jgi:hypothetical protein
MTSEELYALATLIEGEEILGSGNDPLLADDIFPLLEHLWSEGLLRPEPEHYLPEDAGDLRE